MLAFRSFLLACALAVVGMASTAAPGARGPRHKAKKPPAAEAILRRMLARYDYARNFQGAVTTKRVDGSGAAESLIRMTAEGNGRGALNRSRIEVIARGATGRTTTQMLRVDDGHTLWIWMPAVHEYSREPRKADRLSNLFRPLLESARRFGPALSVREARSDVAESPRRYILSGRNRAGRVWIHVDAATWDLVGARAVDARGGELRIEILDQRWGRKAADSAFRFVPPAGARLLPRPPGGNRDARHRLLTR